MSVFPLLKCKSFRTGIVFIGAPCRRLVSFRRVSTALTRGRHQSRLASRSRANRFEQNTKRNSLSSSHRHLSVNSSELAPSRLQRDLPY